MRLTICSYKKRTWKGQYECLNRRGIEFGGESMITPVSKIVASL